MKSKLFTRISLASAMAFLFSRALIAASNDLSATLQNGLLEEEANHNLGAAIAAYQSVIQQFDENRKLAATAIFRSAECYRKQGDTNAAIAGYERVLREFSDQTQLATLCRSYLAAAGQSVAKAESGTATTSEEAQAVQRIKALIRDSPDLINDAEGGLTPLGQAAKEGQLVVAQFLLQNGANIERGNPAPLRAAAQNGRKSMVELLLSKGARAGAQGPDGRTALHEAAVRGFDSIVKILLLNAGAQGVDVNVRDNGGFTPLINAIENRHIETVRLLLAHKTDPGLADKRGRTPLHYAASKNLKEITEALLQNGANPNAADENGATPLHYAAEASAGDAAAALLAHGADPNVTRRDNPIHPAALHIAVSRDDVAMATLLLASKANPSVTNSYGATPLHQENVSVPMTKLLLSKGALPNVRDVEGFTPLLRLAKRVVELESPQPGRFGGIPANNARPNAIKVADALVAAGADVNLPNLDGLTPLALLGTPPPNTDRAKLAALLVEHGATRYLPERDVIQVRRPSANYSSIIFRRGSNDWNQFTLTDLLGVEYQLLSGSPSGESGRIVPRDLKGLDVLGFPDFSHINIRNPFRKEARWNDVTLDLRDSIKSGNCMKDAALEWGSIVEITEADHLLGQPWNGFSDSEFSWLANCLTAHVQIVIKGQAREVALGSLDIPRAPLMIRAKVARWIRPALHQSGLLLASSDLSRVKVTRPGSPPGAPPRQWIIDCSDANSAPDLWLIDGDVIEVPDKPG